MFDNQIQQFVSLIEHQLKLPSQQLELVQEAVFAQIQAAQQSLSDMIDLSSLQTAEQQELIQQLAEFVKPIERQFKAIEFYERFCEVAEKAIELVEEMYSTKKSLFKRQPTLQEMVDRKEEAFRCIDQLEKGIARRN